MCVCVRIQRKKTYEEVMAEAEKQRLLVALCKCPRQKIAVHAAAGAASVWFSKGDAVKCNLFFWTQRVDMSLDLNIHTHTTAYVCTRTSMNVLCALSFCHSIPLFVFLFDIFFLFCQPSSVQSRVYMYVQTARTRPSNQP